MTATVGFATDGSRSQSECRLTENTVEIGLLPGVELICATVFRKRTQTNPSVTNLRLNKKPNITSCGVFHKQQ